MKMWFNCKLRNKTQNNSKNKINWKIFKPTEFLWHFQKLFILKDDDPFRSCKINDFECEAILLLSVLFKLYSFHFTFHISNIKLLSNFRAAECVMWDVFEHCASIKCWNDELRWMFFYVFFIYICMCKCSICCIRVRDFIFFYFSFFFSYRFVLSYWSTKATYYLNMCFCIWS